MLKDPNENVILNECVELLTHQYKYCFTVTDGDYKLLLCIRTFFSKEYAPFKYRIDSVEFEEAVSKVQHVDIVLTDADASVVNSSGTVETIGNVLFHTENVSVNSQGYFIESDTDQTLKSFDISGLDPDSQYNLYIYHKEEDHVYLKEGYTPVLTYIGDNPIWGKICWQDSDLEIYTDEEINTESLTAGDVKWYFSLNNSTHGLGVSGGIQYNIPETEVKNFYFEEVATAGNPSESYTAMHLCNDNPYIKLPNQYYNQNYDDYGMSSNVFPNDIFGDIDYSKLYYEDGGYVKTDADGNYLDRYGNSIMEDDNVYRTLFFKFYISSDGVEDTINAGVTVSNLFETYCSNPGALFLIAANVENGKIILTKSNATGAVLFTNQYDVDISYDTWYTFLLVVKHGTIVAMNVSKYEDYSPKLIKNLAGISSLPGTDSSKRIDVDKTTTMTVQYTCEFDEDVEDTGIAICPMATAYQYSDNDVIVGDANTSYDDNYIKVESGTHTQSV
uniref:Uncharacterized protein n=1 Tax=Dulem virus 42 TaxID=3145760 RepID=A0AAU8B7S6_9CAUD